MQAGKQTLQNCERDFDSDSVLNTPGGISNDVCVGAGVCVIYNFLAITRLSRETNEYTSKLPVKLIDS